MTRDSSESFPVRLLEVLCSNVHLVNPLLLYPSLSIDNDHWYSNFWKTKKAMNLYAWTRRQLWPIIVNGAWILTNRITSQKLPMRWWVEMSFNINCTWSPNFLFNIWSHRWSCAPRLWLSNIRYGKKTPNLYNPNFCFNIKAKSIWSRRIKLSRLVFAETSSFYGHFSAFITLCFFQIVVSSIKINFLLSFLFVLNN